MQSEANDTARAEAHARWKFVNQSCVYFVQSVIIICLIQGQKSHNHPQVSCWIYPAHFLHQKSPTLFNTLTLQWCSLKLMVWLVTFNNRKDSSPTNQYATIFLLCNKTVLAFCDCINIKSNQAWVKKRLDTYHGRNSLRVMITSYSFLYLSQHLGHGIH